MRTRRTVLRCRCPYVRRGLEKQIQPLQFGGGHERGLRSGTLPTHQLVGMGTAYELADTLDHADQAHYTLLKQRAQQALSDMGAIEWAERRSDTF